MDSVFLSVSPANYLTTTQSKVPANQAANGEAKEDAVDQIEQMLQGRKIQLQNNDPDNSVLDMCDSIIQQID